MRITQKGQVTIPEHIRRKYGLLPHVTIEFVEDKGKIYIKLSDKKHQQRGSSIITKLRGSASVGMSTDEILAMTRGKK